MPHPSTARKEGSGDHAYNELFQRNAIIGSTSTIDIILCVPGLETVYFGGALWVALVMEQFSVKHPYTGRYQAINLYTIMADKEMTFCTIFVNGYLRIAKVYPKIDPPWKMVGLAVDIWDNKMKLRDLWEAWEVHQFRLSNITTKMVFVSPLTYQTSRNLFDLTVNYCTIDPCLQSRCHQYRSLSLSSFPGEVRKARKGQSPETATRNEFWRTTKAQYD